MFPAMRARWLAATAAAAVLAVYVSLWAQRGSGGSLLPHGYCFTWNPTLVWTHVISDSLIGLAYVTIPVTLVGLVRKRGDVPFDWIVVLFALFIISCGATHWLEVWTVWNPDYWLLANVKALTALASVATAVALVLLTPRILAIPSLQQLQSAKAALEAEVAQRREVEALLRQERAALEERVTERTAQLAQATEEARRAHAAAEDANALKDRFLAKVSHELRTPLQSTLSWSHVLRQAGSDPGLAARAAERIMHNVRTEARLIDDLLDISRILSGKLKLEMRQADAAQIVRKAAEVAGANAAARGVTIEVAAHGASLPISTDPVRLEQVVWNLINNAVQASPEGGRVAVDLHADAQGLQLRVTDWGRGIAADELQAIFEPFRQAQDGTNLHGGLGLGLAITRNIVDLLGGRLTAHSAGPGRGARFEVHLPATALLSSDAPAEAAGLSPAEHDRLRGLRLLFLEADADLAEGVRLELAALGLAVEVCGDSNQAMGCLHRAPVDVLLVDLDASRGLLDKDSLARLRLLPAAARIPAVALSARASSEDRQAIRQAGFADHLVKPADNMHIARALLAALASAALH